MQKLYDSIASWYDNNLKLIINCDSPCLIYSFLIIPNLSHAFNSLMIVRSTNVVTSEPAPSSGIRESFEGLKFKLTNTGMPKIEANTD